MKIYTKYSLNAKHAAKIIFDNEDDYNNFFVELSAMMLKLKDNKEFADYMDDFDVFNINTMNKPIRTNEIITVKYYTEEFNAFVMALYLISKS